MELLYWLLPLGLILSSVQAESGYNSSKVTQFIYNRCKTYSRDASTYDKIQKRLDDFLGYFKYTTNLIPNGKEQFCKDERPKLINSMRVLSNDLRECFPSHEHYLSGFIYESFKEFLDFLCDQNGHNIDNFFSTTGRECVQALGEGNGGEEIGRCFSFARQSDVVTKKALCEDMDVAKRCFSNSIERHCPNFRAFQTLNYNFFKSIRKPCNVASALIANKFLLVILALLTTKLFL